jgi:hypothetical protein
MGLGLARAKQRKRGTGPTGWATPTPHSPPVLSITPRTQVVSCDDAVAISRSDGAAGRPRSGGGDEEEDSAPRAATPEEVS